MITSNTGENNSPRKAKSSKKHLMTSAALIAFSMSAAPAYAQHVITSGTTTPTTPDDNETVTVASGVDSTVASGDNILVDDGAVNVVITNDGILRNTDADDEDTVVFVDNGESGTIINNNGSMFGVDGVIFVEGDNATINNTGLISGADGTIDEGVVYLDRDAEGTFTINNTATGIIESQTTGAGATIGLDQPTTSGGGTNEGVFVAITINNDGIIRNLNESDTDSDAINLNGDPGTGISCNPCTFNLDITNNGTISQAYNNSSTAAIRFEDDAAFTSGTIRNTATGVITGAANGIYIGNAVDDDGGFVASTHGGVIENSGLIQATVDRAIRVDGGGITINNLAGGTITGPGEGIYFDQGSGPDAGLSGGTVNNAGEISSPDAAVSIRGQAGTALTNTGSLLGLADDANGSDARSVLELTGTADMVTIVNDTGGDITAQAGFNREAVGISIGDVNGDSRTISFTNNGTITANDGVGVVLSANSSLVGNSLASGGAFNNAGMIQSTGNTAVVVDNVAILPTIINSGTFSGLANAFDASDATAAITFEQRGGSLLGDFLGSTGFTDMLNFTTADFTMTNNILQGVNVNVGSGIVFNVAGARSINGDLTSDGAIAFILGTDSLAVSGNVTLNAGSFINVNDINGVVTGIDQEFTLITTGGTLINNSTLNTTPVPFIRI